MADKSKTSSITFRIDDELKAKLQETAQKDHRALSQYIQVLVINHLDSLEAKAKGQGET